MRRKLVWLALVALLALPMSGARAAMGPGDKPGPAGTYCIWRYCVACPGGLCCACILSNAWLGKLLGIKPTKSDCGCGPKTAAAEK